MADCGLMDFECYSKEIASTVWTRTREALQNDINEWMAEQLSTLGTMWVDVPTPDLGTTGAPSGTAPAAPTGDIETHLGTVLGYVSWISGTVAVIGLVFLAVMVGLRIRSGDGVPFHGRLFAVLAGGVLIAGASSLVSALIPTAPAAATNTATFLQSSTWWLAGVCAIVSVMIGGARMAWEQRARPGQELLKSLLTLVVVASVGLTIVWLLVRAGDSFSTWIIDESLECDLDGTPNCFKDNVGVMLGTSIAGVAGAAGGTAGPAAFSGVVNGLFIGVIVGLVSVVQVLLMIVRGGMLVILAGVLPLAASATNTELGRGWFQRCLAWLTAFILYKPAAAIVYAAGFRMTGAAPSAESGAVLTTYTGIVILVLAIVALPALMRFVTPMVGAIVSSGGGAAIATSVADRVPEGARPRPASAPQGSSVPRGGGRASTGGGPASRGSGPSPRAVPAAAGTSAASPGSTRAAASTGTASGGAAAAAGAGKALAGPYVAAAIAGVQPLKKAVQYGTDAAIAVAERTTGEDPSGGR
ncbi:hypothetical protein [Pseudoclavibacter sp. AY1H1]|uniref:hypothetical protein n=1 Tax=Pseudoclavibacter sp. AY1H1 TaxID=2080584 RepID=UPI000CE78CDE|nr:hypothetical protein [Pseudoclavibacter sp. AY1H1]PPF33187.1 hypothetical protein C5E05_18200 [Pseudoclavibacter sp. AY1H1]